MSLSLLFCLQAARMDWWNDSKGKIDIKPSVSAVKTGQWRMIWMASHSNTLYSLLMGVATRRHHVQVL
jgi:hypothetical protein